MKKTLTTVLALSMTFIMAFALVGCAGGSTSGETTAETAAESTAAVESTAVETTESTEAAETETASEEGTAAAGTVLSYDEYMAAELDTEVTVEAYVQATQSWWEDTITVYAQDENGGYFFYIWPALKRMQPISFPEPRSASPDTNPNGPEKWKSWTAPLNSWKALIPSSQSLWM